MAKGTADRSSGKPTTPEHFGDRMGAKIRVRAIRNLMREAGVNGPLAKAIISTPITQTGVTLR